MDINSIPRVTITWLDARDMETGWLDRDWETLLLFSDTVDDPV